MLCKNAHAGTAFWFCYHWNGNVVKGKEKVLAGRCEICNTVASGGELPSFLSIEEED